MLLLALRPRSGGKIEEKVDTRLLACILFFLFFSLILPFCALFALASTHSFQFIASILCGRRCVYARLLSRSSAMIVLQPFACFWFRSNFDSAFTPAGAACLSAATSRDAVVYMLPLKSAILYEQPLIRTPEDFYCATHQATSIPPPPPVCAVRRGRGLPQHAVRRAVAVQRHPADQNRPHRSRRALRQEHRGPQARGRHHVRVYGLPQGASLRATAWKHSTCKHHAQNVARALVPPLTARH